MIKEYENINLRSLNTFGIDARCDRFVEFTDAADLREVFLRMHGHWNVLGGGSNVLLTGDYRGTLLKAAGKNIAVLSDDGANVVVRADAGMVWDDFVSWTVRQGLWGAENLSHIPGTVGAAPVQNIGAYGVEAKDIIRSVAMYDVQSGTMLTLAAGHCAFGYRDSVFKRELRGRVVITSVDFTLSHIPVPRLDYGDLRTETEALGSPSLVNIRAAVIAIRRSKLPDPDEIGNAGSFFKNPVVPLAVADRLKTEYPDMPLYPGGRDDERKLAAGWLIDRAGWKGRSLGPAGVHARQALVLVNLGGATGSDILTLAHRIQADIRTQFGVEIEPEVNVW